MFKKTKFLHGLIQNMANFKNLPIIFKNFVKANKGLQL